jgi:predicted nucleic acid-binding protein
VREVFVDNNVIFDYLLEREPFTAHANAFFEYAIRQDIVLNVCANSYATIYYILRKKHSHESVISDLGFLSKITKCIPVNETVIKQALESRFRDFEDAIQYFCALQIPKCEAIISRDRRDFQLSTIPAMSPKVFMARKK